MGVRIWEKRERDWGRGLEKRMVGVEGRGVRRREEEESIGRRRTRKRRIFGGKMGGGNGRIYLRVELAGFLYTAAVIRIFLSALNF